MGYKSYGETFFKTPKGTQKGEQDTSTQARPTPSQISNEMVLNFLMRIDGKLTDQGIRIEKIEKKLQELRTLMKDKRKTPSGSTTEHAPTTPSPAEQVNESPNQTEGKEAEQGQAKKMHNEESEFVEKDSTHTEVIGSPLHEGTQEAESSSPNSKEVFIMDIFQQMVKEERAENEAAKAIA
ncbi:uncharacterized protein LOC110420764 [Herrania umbratica]|uniref:Uncharacterized protein LOC110420764 n=1 Tax=Herrania umbratica TaxID=108875 RepID=A0A6J1ASE6_9ROSI|nr:uncharacterized protein LOC110420764 [Herrania umbratica]